MADAAQARGEATGPLHGLPVLHKDLTDTAGVRTTYGSPLFKDHIPQHDAIHVERARHAGAIMLGKSNTPEFGILIPENPRITQEVIIPHTASVTRFGILKPGDPVNIEIDMLARYVARLAETK